LGKLKKPWTLTVPIDLIISLFFKNKIKNKEINIKNNVQKINLEINNLKNENNLLEKNQEELEREINDLKNKFKLNSIH